VFFKNVICRCIDVHYVDYLEHINSKGKEMRVGRKIGCFMLVILREKCHVLALARCS
jgi:hypothetical protein